LSAPEFYTKLPNDLEFVMDYIREPAPQKDQNVS